LKNSLAEFAGIFVENLSFQWGEIKIMPTRINHSSVFLIALGREAHEIADYFCQQHSATVAYGLWVLPQIWKRVIAGIPSCDRV